MSLYKIESKTCYQKAPEAKLEVSQTQVFSVYNSAIDIWFQTFFGESTESPKPQVLHIFYNDLLLDMTIITIIFVGFAFLLKKISN